MEPQTQHLAVEALAGYSPQVGRSLWLLEETRRRTKRTLEGIDQRVLDSRPASGGNSIGTLLYHIAVIEVDWLFAEILCRSFPENVRTMFPYDVRDADGRLSHISGIGLDRHIERLDAVRALFLDQLRGMSDEDLDRPRSLERYRVSPAWVINHLAQHESEHRGQITELRRGADSH